MGRGAAAAPAQLQGHVQSPTFIPVPSNCGSLPPPTTVLPLCPTLHGQIFAHRFCRALCLCLCWQQTGTRHQNDSYSQRHPIHHAEKQSEGSKRCPVGAWEVQWILHYSFIVIKSHAHPIVSCSPCSHDTEELHYSLCYSLLNLMWYFDTAQHTFLLPRTCHRLCMFCIKGGIQWWWTGWGQEKLLNALWLVSASSDGLSPSPISGLRITWRKRTQGRLFL